MRCKRRVSTVRFCCAVGVAAWSSHGRIGTCPDGSPLNRAASLLLEPERLFSRRAGRVECYNVCVGRTRRRRSSEGVLQKIPQEICLVRGTAADCLLYTSPSPRD